MATALVIVAGAVSAAAQTITDGDTLKLNGTTYRLWGIDARETKQDCPDGWPAGRMATTRLLALIQGKTIVCEKKDADRYGRTVAVCRASGADLGAIMVREGDGLGACAIHSGLYRSGGQSEGRSARHSWS